MPEFIRYLGLQRIPILAGLAVAAGTDDKRNRDVRGCGELDGSNPQIDAVAFRDISELCPLFDDLRWDFMILRALLVAPAAANKTGITPLSRKAVKRLSIGVVDQRISPGTETYIWVGIVHHLVDRHRRIHTDGPTLD